jgi:hypothetical protein
LQYGAEVKGNARSVVTMKYPEFESDDEDEDDEDDEEEEDEEDEDNIKLPQLITKEAVLAVLKPNGVRPLLHALTSRSPARLTNKSCPLATHHLCDKRLYLTLSAD